MTGVSKSLAIASSWVKSWFVTARVSRQLDAMAQRLDDLETSRVATVAQLRKRERDLHKIHALFLREQASFLDQWNNTWESAQTDFESNQFLIKQYESQIEAMQMELTIYKDLIVPDLTGVIKTMSSANETVIALDSQRRQMLIDPINRIA